MKIIYLIAGTFNPGGMERVLTQKANWLVQHGYDVTIVTSDQRGREPYFNLDKKVKRRDLGINYDEDNGRLVSKLLRFPIRQWRHRRRLTKLLCAEQADIVVCMFNNDVSFVHKIPDDSHKVLEVHFSKNKKLQYERGGLWRVMDQWRTRREERLVGHYDCFVVLTQEDRLLWGDLHNINVIPNARTFTPSRHAPLQQEKVVAVGRYDYQKGFDTLLHIWKKVNDNLNDNQKPLTMNHEPCSWSLDIVGDGPLRPKLQQQVEELGLQDSVRLLPPTNNIEEVLCNASILAMTSRYEGLPMVLLEAQACGLPIVAFACQCGPRDVITDGVDGYLIEGRDETLFADRLLLLMGNEALRRQMGAAASESSMRYTEESIMQQWTALFKKIKQ